MEKIKPGSIGKINEAVGGNEPSHFKKVENISKFLNGMWICLKKLLKLINFLFNFFKI